MAWLADEDALIALREAEDAAPVLVVVSRREETARAVTAAAARVGLSVWQLRDPARLGDRMPRRDPVSVLLIDLDSLAGGELETIRRVMDRFADHPMQLIAVAHRPTLDLALGAMRLGAMDLLTRDGLDDRLQPVLERAMTRSVAMSTASTPSLTALLRQAADEAQGLLRTLGAAEAEMRADRGRSDGAPLDLLELVDGMIKARRARERMFGAELFADPAWDMLLDLFAHHLRGQPVTVSSLCIAAAVPQTTALRRLEEMIAARLVVKERDPHDGRRVFVRLTERTADRLHRFLREHTLAL